MSDIFENALITPGQKIWELLRDGMEQHFKAFYYGDPVLIPESLMPCIIVDTAESTDELGATQFDDVSTTVIVKVIFNKKDDFDAGPEKALSKQKVEFFTEGRDKTTGEYFPFSVKGILRTAITLDSGATNFTSSVDYDVIIRPEDTITQEAHIRFNISSTIEVPNRS